MTEDNPYQLAPSGSKRLGPKHGNICHDCKCPINGFGRIDSRDEFVFHPECFKCAECEDLFPWEETTIKWHYEQQGPDLPADKSQDRFPLHQKCWQKMDTEKRCHACSQPIWLPKRKRVEYGGLYWHELCFKCHDCAMQLSGFGQCSDPAEGFVSDDAPFIRNGVAYCKAHSEPLREPIDLTGQIKLDESQAPSPGGSCLVYLGTLGGERRVAIRALGDWEDDRAVERFRRENLFWFNLREPRNVLPLEGICMDPRGSGMQCGVHPWAENGELSKLVRKHPDEDKIELLIGAAKGLAYLHSSHIIHGDIKGGNILVDSRGVSLIADLGSARFIGQNTRTTQVITKGFEAPELRYPHREPKSYQSDVYAFGRTIMQILCGGTLPLSPEDPAIQGFANIPRYVEAWKLAEECCQDCCQYGYQDCCRTKAKKRPTMEWVVRKLEELRPTV